MEPLDDHELKQLASAWKAPDAPTHLHGRVFGPPRRSWWAWIFTGAIRIPVPACAAILLLVAWLVFERAQPHAQPIQSTVPSTSNQSVTLADFHPPAEVQVRVVGALP